MSIIRWRPFHQLEDLFQDQSLRVHQWDLAVDVYQENGNVIAKMNVPGIDPENISIDIEKNHLHICGKREEEKEVKEKDYYHKEIRRGSFERIVPLPRAVNKDKVSAEVQDGVLVITMPITKEEEKAAQRIKVTKK